MKKAIFFIFLGAMLIVGCKSEPKELTFEEQRDEMIAKMKNTPEWLEALNKKAIESNLPLDTIMFRDAVWMLEQENLAKDAAAAAPVANDTTAVAPEAVVDTVK